VPAGCDGKGLTEKFGVIWEDEDGCTMFGQFGCCHMGLVVMVCWDGVLHVTGLLCVNVAGGGCAAIKCGGWGGCSDWGTSEAENWRILVQRGYYNNPVPAYFSTSQRLF